MTVSNYQTKHKPSAANALLDHLLSALKVRSDAELCRKTGFKPPVISKMRHGRLGVSASAILRIHEVCGIPVSSIREIMRGGVK